MRKRRGKLKRVIYSVLGLFPSLAVTGIGAALAYNTLGKDIVNEWNHRKLIDDVKIEGTEEPGKAESNKEMHKGNITKSDEKELEEKKGKGKTEYIGTEVEKEESTIEEEIEEKKDDVPYPNVISKPKENEISSELLENGYFEEFSSIDFDALKELNPDACAWIDIEGTNIDYPIVQGRDNEEYIHKDINGKDSKNGTIYEDWRNISLEDPIYDLNDFTYVYGHNMKSGAMFADIRKYNSQSYYEKHPYGVIYTTDGYAYKVDFYAGLIVDGNDEQNILVDEFIDEQSYNDYIQFLKDNSSFESEVEVEYGDKNIALITCTYEQENARYVLYGVLSKQYTNENQLENESKSLSLR